jgi:hypothetical protein
MAEDTSTNIINFENVVENNGVKGVSDHFKDHND